MTNKPLQSVARLFWLPTMPKQLISMLY
jgi:hypothetical protein